MRLPRLIVLVVCFVVVPVFLTFLSLLSTHPRRSVSESSTSGKSRFRALFSFHTPSSLFPPSAIISLTDDNSTFFLSRPAAFGPLLPSKGLSGQLWIGSGFGDDNLRRNGAEGELGCSDVPGWGEGDEDSEDGAGASPDIGIAKDGSSKASGKGRKTSVRRKLVVGRSKVDEGDDNGYSTSQDDGTDDHLHQPHQDSTLSVSAKPGQDPPDSSGTGKTPSTEHADIQSLQESAEIAGKIVLLTRGGCGFLEKVKWTQRRGGIALIVGDNTRGGGLVTMYARGDTSNVTIPSLFTSHTTAHLLSSLIPPDGASEDASNESPPANKGRKEKDRKKTKKVKGRPTPTPTVARARPTSTIKASRKGSGSDAVALPPQKRSWLRILLSRLGFGFQDAQPPKLEQDSSRPPSSGELEWILVEDPNEDVSPNKPTPGKDKSKVKPTAPSGPGADDFEIGVQDWRDPDLVGMPSPKEEDASGPGRTEQNGKLKDSNGSQRKPPPADRPAVGASGKPKNAKVKGSDRLPGGSITPSSGEYDDKNKPTAGKGDGIDPIAQSDHGWLGYIPWIGKNGEPSAPDQESPELDPGDGSGDDGDEEDDEEHEGLWVTLTPTSMSTSPFFDTLLVLVVSPLVTLTIVYALLLLRSRIRRRRWRAPKSVVERLPVRTYHTLSQGSSLSSLRIASPHSTSPTSPLLQSAAQPISPRSRQRSHTASDILESPEVSRSRLIPVSESETSRHSVFEKPGSPRPQRKRYVGHQEECVVCLEEYVDGVSRVMRLPCGHEFHADCM
jgi:RING-like zinc finger/PA domain